jgi:integrase
MLKLAERRMLIPESPFRDAEFLEERKQRRRPHIFTFEEEDRLLKAAAPHIRALAVLILETGMRSNREALSLSWNDVDFMNNIIQVRESKTRAGERTIPISDRCKIELLRWSNFLAPEFSPYVFPNMRTPSKPLKDVRRSWAKALKDAGLPNGLLLYELRHTLATRLTQAGVSPLFVAQILGHTGTTILNTYVIAVDEYRRDAIHKLEKLRQAQVPRQEKTHRTLRAIRFSTFALWSLGWPQPKSYNLKFWLRYCSRIRRIAARFGLSLRTVEKALWRYSRDHQPKK